MNEQGPVTWGGTVSSVTPTIDHTLEVPEVGNKMSKGKLSSLLYIFALSVAFHAANRHSTVIIDN